MNFIYYSQISGEKTLGLEIESLFQKLLFFSLESLMANVSCNEVFTRKPPMRDSQK